MNEYGIPSMTNPNYNADRLLTEVRARLNVKTDAALAADLGVTPPVISKIRHHALPVGPSMIIRIAHRANLTLKEIYALLIAEPEPAEQ